MGDKNVFVNCPFDNEYFKLLKPLLFTLCYLDLNPQISETSDSGEIRLHKIKALIENSAYSIHDLSRMEPLKDGELPRFNMPFECGIDFGIKLSDPKKFANKKFLILEKERYRYQKVITEISGNDIKAHNNNPEEIEKLVDKGYLRSVYTWANESVHAGVSGIRQKLSLREDEQYHFLTGPNDCGFLDPVQYTTYSLTAMSEVLLGMEDSMIHHIYEELLYFLQNEVVKEFDRLENEASF